MTNSANTPHDDLQFSVAAIWGDWISGRRTGDAAMEAIDNALTEFRLAREEEAKQ